MTAPDAPRQPLRSGRFPTVHYVLAGRTAVQDALGAFNVLVRFAAQNGAFVPPRVGVYLEELTAALGVVPMVDGSANGSEELPQPDESARWPAHDETVTTEEAAALLGLTTRRVRQLAPVLGGQKVGGTHLLSRTEVLAERDRRREEQRGRADDA